MPHYDGRQFIAPSVILFLSKFWIFLNYKVVYNIGFDNNGNNVEKLSFLPWIRFQNESLIRTS